MAEFAFDLEFSPWQREQAARNLDQTYHLNYRGLERSTANYFRTDPALCVSQAPPAVALRDITAQVRAGKPVRVSLRSFSKQDRYRLSELLLQTANRPYREGNAELGQVLSRLRAAFDQQHKLSADERDRAEHVDLDAAQREAVIVKRENARLRPRVA